MSNQVEVTENAARKMGELCEILKQRGEKVIGAETPVI